MRFFIALEVPEESKNQLKLVQQRLKELLPNIRLTDSDKLHLTIAFIGEKPDELQEKLAQVIQESAEGIPPFSVTPSYIDGFPHLHGANILWVGVKGDIDKLYLIRHRIKDKLSNGGLIADERRYVPHIAIAKADNLKLTQDQELKLQNLLQQNNFQPIKVESVKLYESIPNHGFHSHNTLAKVKLIDT